MRWKIIAVAVLFPLALAFISWEQGQYPEYCEEIDNCTKHNLLIYAWLLFADFFEKFESLFVVVFTACIAWFTWQLRGSTDRLWSAGEKQFLLIGRQADLAEKQHGLAREEFFASHRPRISVTRMNVQQSSNAPIKINFIFVNNGEAEAKECLWNAGILLLEEIGAIHGIFDYSQNVRGKFKGPLAVGMAADADIVDRANLDPQDYEDILAKRKFLHVIGAIAYDDNNGVTRSMGFFRCYDPQRRRFRVVNDSEYEYQD